MLPGAPTVSGAAPAPAAAAVPEEYLEYPDSWLAVSPLGLGSGSRTRLQGGSNGSQDPSIPAPQPGPGHVLLSRALATQQPLHVLVRGRRPRLPAGHSASAVVARADLGLRAVVTGTLLAWDRRGSLVLTDATERAWRLEPLPLAGGAPPPPGLFPPAKRAATPGGSPAAVSSLTGSAAVIEIGRAHG